MIDVDRLEPERIGRLFRPAGQPAGPMFLLGRFRPKIRFLIISFFALLAIMTLANVDHVLIGQGGPSALHIIVAPPRVVGGVEMPLAEDPVGLILIIVALLTPIFAAEQVEAISKHIQMNQGNIQSRPATLPASSVPVAEINNVVASANKAYRIVGGRWTSLLILATSVAPAYLIYTFWLRRGLLESWNSTRLANNAWGQKVYDGWWANGERHLAMAVLLIALAAYMFYFLEKQLILGMVFARFANRAAKLGFAIIPNMDFNSDGYWGLRPLRGFIQWTFGSTIAHLVATLAVFLVWLPFTQWTLTVAVGVMLVNWLVVFYPTRLALDSAIKAKTAYAEQIAVSTLPPADKEKYYERIWGNQSLPFRTRSAMAAATIYFLVPLLLLLISSLLNRGH